MRILIFTDVHQNWNLLEEILNKEADFYICLGDIAHSESAARKAQELIRDYLDNFLIVPGNCDFPGLENYLPVLDGEVVTLGDAKIGGVGGSTVTPFGTYREYSEDYFRGRLSKLGKIDILLTHCPPAGTRLALTASGVDAGSTAIREYIEAKKPKIAFCGHIHEREGEKDEIAGVEVINPGRGYVLEI